MGNQGDSDTKIHNAKPRSAFRAVPGTPAIIGEAGRPKVGGGLGPPSVGGSRDFEDFVYILSHDVRGSVRALLEVPTWIQEDLIEDGIPVVGSLSENLSLMERHAHRLDQMLTDLLTYSRVGRKQAMRSVFIDTALNTALLAQKIPSTFKVTWELQCKTIKMGEDDVETLLTALVSNAIKHHDRQDGSVHILSQVENGQCVFSVMDDGPGIPEKSRDRMLEAMTTLKSRDEVEGSGMGLAIVRKIVDVYGGNLEWGDTEGARGTAIRVTLPV